MIKSGLKGRVVNTLRNLYHKTFFRVKHGGQLSARILQELGVNQGGNASPTIFREYMADLKQYLHQQHGVCLSEDEILLHLLWADDLILISTTLKGCQLQLNGLQTFCSKNQCIVNEIKTKLMIFGNHQEVILKFNNRTIEQVKEYKYVGNIVRSTHKSISDVFSNNFAYLCGKAKQAIFSLKLKLRKIGTLPPKCMFYLFHSLIQPILTYGSDVWGVSKSGREAVDKVLLWYLRMVLNVKATTSNSITLGECGVIPTSVTCIVNAIVFFQRLKLMPESNIVNMAFREQERLHNLGFRTWYGRVLDLARIYGFDMEALLTKDQIRERVTNAFINHWAAKVQDPITSPLLRTYSQIKCEFGIEPYLLLIKNVKFRNSFAKLRASSHTLEIERGRHTRPKTLLCDRLCSCCNEIENEEHFLLSCRRYTADRNHLFNEISKQYPIFRNMCHTDKFVFLMSNQSPQILTWTGKFIYNAFITRTLPNTQEL